ncbi:MAG: hypothetical protein ACE5QV_00635, partial [Fidelibacterota bacterium]
TNSRIRYSTTAINDGRQSMGIYNTLAFILEGKRYGDLITNIERRAYGQFAALSAFLKTVVENRKEILAIVRSAREELVNGSPEGSGYIYIRMDYFPDPDQKTLTFPVFDLYTWKRVEKPLENYEPLVRIKKSVKRPYAYIFSQKEDNLIQLLRRHQIEMFRLKSDAELEIETYRILHVTPAVEEDKPAVNVDVDVQRQTRRMEKGSVVVKLNQKAANLIPLLLEPQSSWGIAADKVGSKYRFTEYLQEGKEYPIFRLMNPIDSDLELPERE